jgi:hypothetical protein
LSEVPNESRPVVDPEAEGLPGTADDDSTAYDDTQSARIADGPDPAALPADHPIASLDYGTTPAEAGTAEPLSDRLDREEPEPDPYAEAADPDDPTDPATVSDQPDPGDDTIDPDELAYATPAEVTGVPGAGPGLGTSVTGVPGAGPGLGDDPAAAPRAESPDEVADGPDPDGTLTGVPGDGLVDVTGADQTDSDELRGPEEIVEDLTELDVLDQDPTDLGEPDEALSGRLVTPDEGAHPDREPTEIAQDSGSTTGLTAEEAAMHEER